MSGKIIRVWDPLVRIFHWSLVVVFTIAYLTGEEESNLHIYAGYAVLGLVLFRILWGFVGSEHARFANFVCTPTKAIKYLGSLVRRSPEYHVGHNPTGGYMVVLMLATLLVVTVTGLKVYGLEGQGILAYNSTISIISVAHADGESEEADEAKNEHDEEYWEELHEAYANFMLGLILIHILGIFISSNVHRENLVKAMIIGDKKSL
jgi:cytochrome b